MLNSALEKNMKINQIIRKLNEEFTDAKIVSNDGKTVTVAMPDGTQIQKPVSTAFTQDATGKMQFNLAPTTPGASTAPTQQQNPAQQLAPGSNISINTDPNKTQQTMGEGGSDNFTIDDIKALEKMHDLDEMKAKAFELISTPSKKPMKPEKIEWFKHVIDHAHKPMQIIKLMYDLLLSGEGHGVVGSKHSMKQNSYRSKFGEEQELDDIKRLSGL